MARANLDQEKLVATAHLITVIRVCDLPDNQRVMLSVQYGSWGIFFQ